MLNDFVKAMKTLKIPMKDDFSRPHTLCQTHYSSMMIDRKEEIRNVIQGVENRSRNRKQLDRISNPILAIFSAPGGGKSRFLDILADHVQKMDTSSASSCLRGSVVLAISYNGATGTSSSVDKELGMSAGFGLAARILWSYFAGHNLLRFYDFCCVLQEIVPHLSPALALNAVVEHRTCAGSLSPPGSLTLGGVSSRVLLLVDEVIKSDEVAEGFSYHIISQIGLLLDSFADLNAVVTSLKPGPLLQLTSASGRPVTRILLRPFTLEESVYTLQATFDLHTSFKEMMTLCVSDVGGHPWGLETLQATLDSFFKE
jgi:hypothetical protein